MKNFDEIAQFHDVAVYIHYILIISRFKTTIFV
jgi:hypothetical protein